MLRWAVPYTISKLKEVKVENVFLKTQEVDFSYKSHLLYNSKTLSEDVVCFRLNDPWQYVYNDYHLKQCCLIDVSGRIGCTLFLQALPHYAGRWAELPHQENGRNYFPV